MTASDREIAMRDSTPAWPKTEEEMLAQIRANLEGSHDYGTCVYAMSLSALAAFHYVASKLGVTGFQASCADMDFLRRTRGMKGGFLILKAEDLLFPQDDLRAKLEEFIAESREWLCTEARKLLDERSSVAHPNVLAHWKKLAED